MALLFGFAFAAEPLAEGVQLLPAGSEVSLKQGDGTVLVRSVVEKSFILPEPLYDNALVSAKKLKICEPALDAIAEETFRLADRTYATLSKCSGQFDVDEVLIQDLTGKIQSLETRALLAEDRLKVSRTRTAVAWSITGGVVLGITGASILAISR